jgi:hypothetical protein
MAIALDTSATNTTASFSYTCTGSNLILFVGITWNVTGSNSTSAPTYNGVALTQIGTNTANGSANAVELWYLVAPATGAHTLAVTVNASGGMRVNVESYTGVAQTNPIDGSTSATPATFNNTTPATLSITTTVANDWIVSPIIIAGSSATTEVGITSPGVIDQNNTSGTSVSTMGHTTTTTAGSNSLQWTRTQATSRAPSTIAAAFKPFVAVTFIANPNPRPFQAVIRASSY